MKIRSVKTLLIAGCLAGLSAVLVVAALASQGSLNVPTTGPLSPTAFAGQVNTALDAIISKNSGSSAPTNFPTTGLGASQFQDWMDTSPSAGMVDHRINDGGAFLNRGALDTVNHLYMPKIGGGSGTIASGTTVDIGSIRHSYVVITGSVPGTPIASFGSNVLLNVGESKFVRAAAAGIITFNGTSMLTPGSADLPFNAGDTFQLVYLGSGNWLIFDYQRAAGLGKATGELFSMYGTGTVPGAVRANGRTIGDASSSATERANADTVNLFIWLYLQDANLTVSSGRTAPGNTRATAITDYNAHKTILLPDTRGRSERGLDDEGNSAASRITSTTASPDGVTLGATGGAQTSTIAQGNLPNVTLATAIASGQGSHNHTATTTAVSTSGGSGSPGGSGIQFNAASVTVNANTLPAMTGTTPLGGSGTALDKMDPFILVTKYLAL